MKLPGLSAVVLLSLFPMSARAQSITLKDITGAWSRGNKWNDTINDTLFIRADSTFLISTTAEGWTRRKWSDSQPVNHLRGDTLSLSKSESPAVCRGERLGYCGEPGYRITLKGQRLTLTSLDRTGPYYSGDYTRVNADP